MMKENTVSSFICLILPKLWRGVNIKQIITLYLLHLLFKVLRPIIRVVILHSGCNVICFNLASWIWFDINSTPNSWLHKYIKASIWHKNILGYLSTEIIWSEKLALRKLFPSQSKSCLQTNTQAYFGAKWRLLWLLSSKHFAVCRQNVYKQCTIYCTMTFPF